MQSDNNNPQTDEEREAEEKAARMEYARRAGILTPEIASMPDGGRAVLGEETWQRLQDYAAKRARGRR